MRALGIMDNYRMKITEELRKSNFNYNSINLLLDLYIKFLIEENRKDSNLVIKKTSSKKLINYCLDSIIIAIDQINSGNIVLGLSQTREIFETFISILALEADEEFELNIDTKTGECRSIVLDNKSNLFGDLEFNDYKSFNKDKDVHEFYAFYEWLSKIGHPTPMKLYLIELQNNKKIMKVFPNLLKENLLYIVLLMLFFLENKKTPTKEEKEFRSSIINATTAIHFINIVYFSSVIGRKEIIKYQDFFLAENDKVFIETCNKNAKKVKQIIDDNLKLNNLNLVYNSEIVNKYIIKKEYEKTFKSDMKKLKIKVEKN